MSSTKGSGSADAPVSKAAGSTFDRVMGVELDSLASMAWTIQVDDISRCVQWMNAADHVVVVGSMGSTSLAEYFA